MTKTAKRNEYLMRVAELTSLNSYARRSKVGAILVKEGRIIATGYNGQPRGLDNSCEIVLDDGTLQTKDTVIHSEANAIYFCAKHGLKTEGTDLYVTMSPCVKCALAIIQAGIKHVYYREEYRDTSGIEFLKKNNIKVEQLKRIDI